MAHHHCCWVWAGENGHMTSLGGSLLSLWVWAGENRQMTSHLGLSLSLWVWAGKNGCMSLGGSSLSLFGVGRQEQMHNEPRWLVVIIVGVGRREWTHDEPRWLVVVGVGR